MEKRIITREAVNKALSDYLRQYKANLFSSLVAFIVPAIGNILVAYVPPLIVGKIVDVFIKNGKISLSLVIFYLVIFGALWTLGEVFWRFGFHHLIKVETNGINNLCKDSFEYLVKRDYDFYSDNFVGTLSKKAFAYARNFEMLTDTLVFNVSSSVFPIIFVTIVLWQYSPWIPTILIACLIFAVTISIPLIRKRSKLVAARHDANSKMVGRLSDSLTNIFAVKSFAKEKQEARVFGKYVDDFTDKFKKSSDYHNLRIETMISPIYVATNLIGLIAAIFFADRLGLQAGAIIVVFSYYASMTRIFWEVNHIYRNLEVSITEAAEFTQMFLAPQEIRDVPNAKDLVIKNTDIEFKQVNFAYTENEDKQDSFLNDFNLKILSNQRVGLVGPSGGGKTTITKLLLRFIDPQSGIISVDGQNTKEITQSSLREAISYVPQEPLLFHRTLFENIAYGNPKATKEEVIKAAKMAHAHEFIAKLPQSYETLVGERGIKLSGGQRQRVAIARALLKKSPIIILDEATSSLDSESEKYIQEGLWKLMKGKTALVIAHRLSTVKHLDRIIVLENGEIVQDGSHQELIEQGGLYAKLWSHQSGKEPVEETID